MMTKEVIDPADDTLNYVAFGNESVDLMVARVAEKDETIEWSEVKEWEGITVYRGVVQDNEWNCIKAVGRVNCSARYLADQLTNPKEMPRYDANTNDFRVLEEVGASIKVLHVHAKAIFPTTARDFVVVTAEGSYEDNIVIASRSIDHADAPLDSWNYVRATTYLSGYFLHPISDSECELTMIVHMNLGGSLPSFVINLLAVDAPIYLIQRLRELYEPLK